MMSVEAKKKRNALQLISQIAGAVDGGSRTGLPESQKHLLSQGKENVLLTQWRLASRRAFSFSGNTPFSVLVFHLSVLVCAEISIGLFALSVFKASGFPVYAASSL